MQFTIAIAALFAVAASAASIDTSNTMDALQSQAKSFLAAKEAAGCQKIKCIIALAPTAVSCAAVVAEVELNPIADIACLATLTNSAVNTPASCQGCI